MYIACVVISTGWVLFFTINFNVKARHSIITSALALMDINSIILEIACLLLHFFSGELKMNNALQNLIRKE